MRFLSSFVALLMAVPALAGSVTPPPNGYIGPAVQPPVAPGTPVNWAAASFTDPFNTQVDDLLLSISVETACPDSLTITVYVPGPGLGLNPTYPVGGWFVGTGVPQQSFAGSYQGHLAGADISIVFNSIDGSSVWSFSNFKDIYSYTGIPAWGSSGYTINVDVIDGLFTAQDSTFALIAPPNQAAFLSFGANAPSGYQFSSYFTASKTTDQCNGPAGPSGDPQFAGFQGQNFQFHGLADEHFNLISSPNMQVNSHFVYLANGECDFNDTVCWTHPGTYIDQVGWSYGASQVRAIAGSHAVGMAVFLNEKRLSKGHYKFANVDGEVTVRVTDSRLHIISKSFSFELVNADYFFNLAVSALDHDMLMAGSKKHTITDRATCTQHSHGAIEAALLKKYQVAFPVHGLVGQTWRNVEVCGKQWIGSVQDYVVSNLFSSDYTYNFYNSTQ